MAKQGLRARCYVAMRYWEPFTSTAIAQMKADGIRNLVVLPLYPQFSISTSGSSLRLLEKYFYEDQEFNEMKTTVIPAWYGRRCCTNDAEGCMLLYEVGCQLGRGGLSCCMVCCGS